MVFVRAEAPKKRSFMPGKEIFFKSLSSAVPNPISNTCFCSMDNSPSNVFFIVSDIFFLSIRIPGKSVFSFLFLKDDFI